MKISNKIEDFKLYVENENKQYISSSFIGDCEKSTDKRIYFKINLGEKLIFSLDLTREEMKSFAELINEISKQL